MNSSFHERIIPGPGFYIALLLLVPAVVVVFTTINPAVGWILGPALYLFFAGITTALSPQTNFDGHVLTTGKAHIPVSALGDVMYFRGEEAQAARGPELDVRAFLNIRGALPVLKVDIADANDPCPYWLISTRRPEELAAKIRSAKPTEVL